jgi:hypothetical protein
VEEVGLPYKPMPETPQKTTLTLSSTFLKFSSSNLNAIQRLNKKLNFVLIYVWMEGEEGREEEGGGEDGLNILKISTFHESSSLLSSPYISLCPKHTINLGDKKYLSSHETPCVEHNICTKDIHILRHIYLEQVLPAVAADYEKQIQD